MDIAAESNLSDEARCLGHLRLTVGHQEETYAFSQEQPMMGKSGIFISYARKDGEVFANELRERLKKGAPDLPVWQDRQEIKGGVGWWRQIEEALERVEFLVIVMTDAVLRSDITSKEWRLASSRPGLEGSGSSSFDRPVAFSGVRLASFNAFRPANLSFGALYLP